MVSETVKRVVDKGYTRVFIVGKTSLDEATRCFFTSAGYDVCEGSGVPRRTPFVFVTPLTVFVKLRTNEKSVTLYEKVDQS